MAIDPENLKHLRTQVGLTQGQLAKLAGVSQQLVGAIEKGTVRSTRHVYALARALMVDPSTLDPDIPGADTSLPPTIDWGVEKPARAENDKLPILGVLPGKKTDRFDALVRPPIEYRPRSSRGTFGIFVADESMSPRYEIGEVIEVKVGVPISRTTDVVLFDETFNTMTDADGFSSKMIICRLLDWDDDEWTIEKYNPTQIYKLPRHEWPVALAIVGHQID